MQQQESASGLTRFFDKVIVSPLEKIFGNDLVEIPVLILSLCLCYGAFYTSIRWIEVYPFLPVLLLALSLILLRIVLRSTQKKKSVDLIVHSLNSLNYGLICLIAFQYYALSQWLLFTIFILLSYAVSAFYYYYRFKSNSYPAVIAGSSDMTIAIIGLMLISLYPPALEFIQRPLVDIYNLIDITIIFISCAMGLQLIKLIRNVPHITYGIWLFIGGLLLIVIFGYQPFTPLQLSVSLALYGGLYISKLNVAILVDGVERSTGLFTPIMVVVSFFMESFTAINTFIIITAYMLFNIAMLLYKSIKSLKSLKKA